MFCGHPEGDFPIGSDLLKTHLHKHRDCKDVRDKKSTSIVFSKRKVSRFDAVYGNMSSAVDRIRSYSTWPDQIQQDVQRMVKCGLFYSGRSDLTICFHCGCQIIKWKKDDDPFQRHLLENIECVYARFMADKFVME
jgi:hypothetical protein